MFPSQMRDKILVAGPGPAPEPPSSWTCPVDLPWEMAGGHSYQMLKPPQLTPFDAKKQWLYSESLPDISASHPIPEGEPRYPVEEPYFSCL
ncbi:hypothetical protein LDENG_00020730 [Lucifuga dentata]|nr:hypothetical protein LDENG_00020730 [Lucifuga dentata]